MYKHMNIICDNKIILKQILSRKTDSYLNFMYKQINLFKGRIIKKSLSG
ncbi:hypothetical protein SAMN04515674_109136 [Pseudarcicella hirudinis]|uniref:Uncharacterized protein n=1 Tax=Pseudarcicella hirudinis TaxID=1079859 RepID=A0A1I5VID9_9BACT|nr:hypothetical protein SAMN04515674_109136 [Pseudarcicella hirudinis]